MGIKRLRLELASGTVPSLVQTIMQRESDIAPLISVRGKTAGAYLSAGTFQWTRAVHAITLILIQYKLKLESGSRSQAILVGERDSLASSLDFAISKRPSWLCEMFGTTATGEAFASRVFLRSNPNRKRPGPVAIGVNEKLLTGSALEIYLDGKPCDYQKLANLALRLQDNVMNEGKLAA